MSHGGFNAQTPVVSTDWPRPLDFIANEEMRHQVLYSERRPLSISLVSLEKLAERGF